MVTTILGGIGLLLIGMILMTNGIKSIGGDTLRRLLTRFIGSPLSAIFSGFAITSIVQASTATLLATIGFVSAGLISFTQGISIILGSNLGTTTIGWFVAALGFKFNIGAFAMPLVGIGALLMLLARGRVISFGMVIAGFGLLFFGIHNLQSGMAGLANHIDIKVITDVSWTGRFILICVGILMSIMMQSSTAALVTTMAALNTNNITLEQSAALVIGQSIGKTSTAIIATIGASVQAKRAAFVHIAFNCVTGIIVYFLFDFIIWATRGLCHFTGIYDSSIILSAFNSAFNLFGIILAFPFISVISNFIIRIIPERGSSLTRNLDKTVTNVAPIAIEAARRTAIDIAAVVIGALRGLIILKMSYKRIMTEIKDASKALKETNSFMSKVRSQPGSSAVHQQHLAILHALDHLEQLVEACMEREEIRTIADAERLRVIALEKLNQLDLVIGWLKGYSPIAPLQIVEATSRSIAGIRRSQRVEILEMTANGAVDPNSAMKQLEALRWLDRLAHHIWRAIYYLNENLQEQVEKI